MGMFDKFKNIFKKEEKEEVELYDKGLEKTRNNFLNSLINLNKRHNKIDDEYFEELEEILIMADIGVNTVMNIIEKLKARVKKEHIETADELKEIIVDEMFIIYVNNDIIVNKINYSKEGPTVILFVGVNGAGKTTTIGKIAYKLKNEGKKVLMVAGDTFRAGAINQLIEWGNLMKELEKINKVIGKLIEGAPHETLLVVDATTGQNGISQAKNFKEITDITGVVLTKLDGTAKGGIVLAIKDSTGIPVKFVGLGERKEDLRTFDIEKYIYGLFKGMEE